MILEVVVVPAWPAAGGHFDNCRPEEGMSTTFDLVNWKYVS